MVSLSDLLCRCTLGFLPPDTSPRSACLSFPLFFRDHLVAQLVPAPRSTAAVAALVTRRLPGTRRLCSLRAGRSASHHPAEEVAGERAARVAAVAAGRLRELLVDRPHLGPVPRDPRLVGRDDRRDRSHAAL